jgi:glutamate carboxypeptidase
MPAARATPIPADAFDLEEILAGIVAWTSVESPTFHLAGVNRMMDFAEGEMRAFGARIERLPGLDGYGDCVVARLPDANGRLGPGILILIHLDTVHLVGTIMSKLSLKRDGDRLYGPGVWDMKSGGRIAIHAVRTLQRLGRARKLPITFMFTSDEEVGSPANRARIEAEARQHKYVLVPEPMRGTTCVSGRHAFQRWWVKVHGRPAHAGSTNREGRNAIRALAQLIERIEKMTDYERGITYSVGTVEGGTFVNVIPIEAKAQVLAVAPDEEAFAEIPRRMLALAGEEDGVRVEIEKGPVRPLFRANAGTMMLYEKARAIAADIGFELGHAQTGGGSDGNFTGAMGLPTLDGLGCAGSGAHTFGEYLTISSVVPRCRLLAGLIDELA